LLGPYAVQERTGGGGSSHVIPIYSITPVDGLDAALLSQTRIALLDGNDLDAAVAAAKRAKIAIVMVGDDEGEDHDHRIELPDAQNRLIEAVAKVNPRTIVVLKSGSAVLMPWLKDVPAVLEAWYPGEEDGNAVADVLFGKVNPSGKLPLTFPRSVADTLAKNPGQYPGDSTTVNYSEGLRVGYRAFQGKNSEGAAAPLFPFGFGLSYTTFQFDGLKVAVQPDCKAATVSFRLTNTGARDGAEVAQLYLTYPDIAEGNEPPRELKEFQKVMLRAEKTEIVTLRLNTRSFSYWSENAHDWKMQYGTFKVSVGNSSQHTPLETTLNLGCQ
jgi:beta-glucosidase